MSQQSIRTFFQPRQLPKYAAPPSSTSSSSNPAPPSANIKDTTSQATSTPVPPPPPALSQPDQPNQPAELDPLSITLLIANLPVLPPPPSLPAQASIVPVVYDHIPALRRINSLLLPVAYPDSFYAKALDPSASGLFSRAILWQDDASSKPKVVGGVVCRLERNPFLDASGRPQPVQLNRRHQFVCSPDTPYYAIYIQSLALLSPFRAQGLAAAALEHIVASAALLSAAGSGIDVRTIYAHVWTDNTDGLKWYKSRGFRWEGSEPIPGYYFKLRPDTAWIVQRDIGPDAPSPPLGPAGWQTAWQSPSELPAGPITATTTQSITGGIVAAAVNLPPVGSSTTGIPPPPRQPSTTPSSSASSLSFQNARPETEWNDLPADMVAGGGSGGNGPGRSQLLSPPSAPGSAARSRSSSAVRKKKDRAYPTAAFGS